MQTNTGRRHGSVEAQGDAMTTDREQVTTAQANHDDYSLVEGLISTDAGGQFAERLQRYASGDIALSDDIGLQREPNLTPTITPPHWGGTDIRKVAGLFADSLFATLIRSDHVTTPPRSTPGQPDVRMSYMGPEHQYACDGMASEYRVVS